MYAYPTPDGGRHAVLQNGWIHLDIVVDRDGKIVTYKCVLKDPQSPEDFQETQRTGCKGCGK